VYARDASLPPACSPLHSRQGQESGNKTLDTTGTNKHIKIIGRVASGNRKVFDALPDNFMYSGKRRPANVSTDKQKITTFNMF
jgi:hypothetical protein